MTKSKAKKISIHFIKNVNADIQTYEKEIQTLLTLKKLTLYRICFS